MHKTQQAKEASVCSDVDRLYNERKGNDSPSQWNCYNNERHPQLGPSGDCMGSNLSVLSIVCSQIDEQITQQIISSTIVKADWSSHKYWPQGDRQQEGRKAIV